MARVNHKLVRQRLNEKRSKISNRQFFTSRVLAGHYEDIAAAQTRRYHYNRRVRVQLFWQPKSSEVAMTNNMVININAGNKIVTDVKGRVEQYNIVTGLFAHELGHVLHTDFLAAQTYSKYFLDNRWYPYPPVYLMGKDALNESDLWEYVKADERNRKAVLKLLHTIENILEDGYIENRMMAEFPGVLAYGLECVRKEHFAKIDTVTDMKEKEANGQAHIFTSLMQVLLSYAKFGEIKYGDEPFSDVRIKTIFDMLPEIDTAVASRSIKDRMNVSNLFLIRCWEYAKEYCELCKAAQEAAKDCGIEEEIESVLSGALSGSMSGLSNEGEGNSIPVSGDSGKSNAKTESNRQKTRAIAASAKQDEAESEEKPDEAEGQDEEKAKEQSKGKNESGEEQDTDAAQPSIMQGGGESQDSNGSEESQSGTPAEILNQGKQDVQSGEGGRIPLEQTESVYEPPEEGDVEFDEDYQRENYDKAASDINRMLESMAEKSACEELENERLSELNEMARSISYGNIHAGVNIKVHRIASVDEDLVEYYNTVSAPLIAISKQLQKNLLRQLKDMRLGGKLTGLMMGRRLDSHSLHRNDGKVFYKNNLPQDVPQLAVGLLLDESGSMSSEDRATYARAAAIILYDFCQSLDIPVTVYGHSTSYYDGKSTVDLYSYAEFESIDKNDKFRLMDISARGSNRDGAALRFVAEKLVTRPETVKILILVSDGQPADYGYSGTAAEEDLRGIKQEYQRKGITFVAAAIGSDKVNIERIYGDSFLDITDLNQLPVKLTAVVKRHIRT